MRRISLLFAALAAVMLGCSGNETEVESASPTTSRVQQRTGQLACLRLPQGFDISYYATSLDGPRLMALSPDGRLFVTETDGGRVTILPDANGDGRADSHITYASRLNRPHGIAFHSGHLYIAETNRVIRYPYRGGDTRAPRPEVIISNIPTGGHSTRTIVFGQDGKLHLSVGSSCNVCVEQNPIRAAVSRYNPDGSGRQIVATGLRNAVGMAVNPDSGEVWVTENERDRMGDDIPPDEVNVLRDGGFYGWPYAYGNRIPDPEFGDRAPDKVRDTIPPRIAIQAHSAPLGLAFYTGSMFPAAYQGGLFVAYHGSWNRSVPTGYKVVRFPISNGSVGSQQDFITGWRYNGDVWGRPVGLLVGRFGELYVTDDSGGRIYRVTYRNP